MALRLRRGTDAERQLITPAEGELIYTTDTKALYAGDGSTVGGTIVTGGGGGAISTLEALTDTDLSDTENGDVLAFNSGTNKWEPALVPGVSEFSLNDINDVYINTDTLATGDFLRRDGAGNFTNTPLSEYFAENMNWAINIVGVDSTMLVDSDNSVLRGTLIGSVEGDLDGDVKGSVFGDDSTLIVDGVNNTLNADSATLGTLEIDGKFPNLTGALSSISETITSSSLTKKLGIDARLAMFGEKGGIDVYSDSDTADDGSVFSAFTASNTEEPSIELYRSRGTLANQLPLQDEDNLTLIAWGGTDSDSVLSLAAGIGASVDGTPTSGIVPGALSFLLTDSAGNFAPALQVTNDGLIVADNTVVAGAASGEVDNSAVVDYLKITVGSTTLALPLYAIRP